MGRGVRLLLVLVVALAALPAASASATTLPAPFAPPCPADSPDGDSYGGVHICSGSVPSFDGAKLDVDLTQPAQGTGTSHPLIVMLHGFGNDKRE
jgi:poly(3-hydroxybutyrate) depolymerase